jgi:hypothetical protein
MQLLAAQRGGNAKKIATAKTALAQGDELRTQGRYKDALARYKDAASQAEGA